VQAALAVDVRGRQRQRRDGQSVGRGLEPDRRQDEAVDGAGLEEALQQRLDVRRTPDRRLGAVVAGLRRHCLSCRRSALACCSMRCRTVIPTFRMARAGRYVSSRFGTVNFALM